VIELEPEQSYWITLKYINHHPICKRACYVHNSLTTREPALSAELIVNVPNGYRFDVIAVGPREPDVFKDRWIFRIPGPLLPHQMIEYVLRKK
jgi:hypothetical protein